MTDASAQMLLPQEEGIPVPRLGERYTEYWDGCRRGRLLNLRCDSCDKRTAWHVTICDRCHGSSLSWVPGEGRGSLYSWTVVWRPQHPRFRTPYAPAIVELDEGYFMMSAMVGCRPEDLHAGLRVEVEFHEVAPELNLPYFRPATRPQ